MIQSIQYSFHDNGVRLGTLQQNPFLFYRPVLAAVLLLLALSSCSSTPRPDGMAVSPEAGAGEALAQPSQEPAPSLLAEVPILEEDQVEELAASISTVSYKTPLKVPVVFEFYWWEMPTYGWEPLSEGAVATDTMIVQFFATSDRLVSVTIRETQDYMTSVLIRTLSR